ncbi:MAG: hypothetical protein OSA46_06215 [Schleiferiaceae bacterium]|nr:hypothetical protein [Schleiferiaceae bacterium]
MGITLLFFLTSCSNSLSEYRIGDYLGAVDDLNVYLESVPADAGAYLNRGLSKIALGDIDGASSDMGKAAEFGDTHAAQ